MSNYKTSIFFVLLAIAVTTTMDFTGYTMFSALPLLIISLVAWLIQRLSRTEIGLIPGSFKNYGYAFLYPFAVLGLTFLVAYIVGDYEIASAGWSGKYKNLIAGSTIGILGVLLTEEGFFRGWLWGSLRQKGMSARSTLLVTTLAFALWHVSAVTSGTDYGLPPLQVPVYLINVILMGLIWGVLRWRSGSVIVPSVCHAVWNALAYELFGFGTKTGALGVQDTFWLGPEVGLLGIALNGVFLIWLWNR